MKRLQLDDCFLIFACICLVLSTFLLLWGLTSVLLLEKAELGQINGMTSDPANPVLILEQLRFFEDVNWAYLTLTWTTIFSVKAAFLAFFRHLVNRLHSMHVYWKAVVICTALVFVVAVCDAFITCSHVGTSARQQHFLSNVFLLAFLAYSQQ